MIDLTFLAVVGWLVLGVTIGAVLMLLGAAILIYRLPVSEGDHREGR